MQKAIIGVTTLRAESPAGLIMQGITQSYLQALTLAGAIPVMIPLGLPEEDLDRLHRAVDGLLFTGGADIDPARYGAELHPRVYRVDQDRDRVEIHLAQQAVEQEKPFLAICRGLQVVNVALGGGLYTDIQDQHAGALKHDYWAGRPRDFLAHPVQIDEGSRLADITGKPILEVNSIHHQAVNRLAGGLRASAYAPDGILEAFELPEHPFGVAVQWHPENLTAIPEMLNLFEALAAASNGKV